MTRDAGLYVPQQPGMPTGAAQPPFLSYQTPVARASLATRKRTRLGDRYFLVLCICLLGYALAGRGFAYIGVNPLFIGEIMLLIGVLVLIKCNVVNKLLGIRMFIPLMVFMAWGAACTIPYLEKYQKDAIRDAVIWGYGTYAFIVAGVLIASPIRLQKLVLYYRKFVFWFLILAPITSTITSFFYEQIPQWPGTGVPIVQAKGGDLCVHLGGVFAFIVALGNGINPWITALLVPMNLGLNLQGRAGMVAFIVAAFAAFVLRPFHQRSMRIIFVIAMGLFMLWATDIRIEKGARELSFRQLVTSFKSIIGESDEAALNGTKEWRMNWWTDIVNYTVYGKYFWTGKGFGINLASDDGYQTEIEEGLRSPHNGHMTFLARSGVPGLCFWLIVQTTFGVTIVKSYFRSRKRGHLNWSGMFLFLGAYWAAFMANTSFDVFIEGPMGGIWLWCIYGAGIAATYLYKRHPDLLTPARPAMLPTVVSGS
jgi:hypothetical protein